VLIVLILATAATLAFRARRLPAQNVLALTFLIVVLSSAVEVLNHFSGLPFGPSALASDLRPKIFGVLPWSLPLLWIVLVLNCRDLAGWILRSLRENKFYGFWLIGLASLLSALFWLAIEAIAASSLPASLGKYFFGKLALSLLILVAIAPWLIKKGPR
jgi:uncharacterized membrane protein